MKKPANNFHLFYFPDRLPVTYPLKQAIYRNVKTTWLPVLRTPAILYVQRYTATGSCSGAPATVLLLRAFTDAILYDTGSAVYIGSAINLRADHHTGITCRRARLQMQIGYRKIYQ